MEWTAVIWAGVSGAVAGVVMATVEAVLSRTAAGRLGPRIRHALASGVFLLVFLSLRDYSGRYALLDRVTPLLPERFAFQLRMERHGRRLMELPGMQAMLEAAPSKAAALEIGKRLAAQGIPRLDDAMLLQRAIVFSKMLTSADDAGCTALARGTPTSELLVSSLGDDPAMFDNWYDMVLEATRAELEKRPVPQLSKADVERALLALRQNLPGDQSSLVLSALAGSEKVSDRDICSVVRTLYKTAIAMPEPDRALLLRALTQ